MPYGNLLADVVQSSTTGTPPQFNDGNGTQTGTLCRAWVNFNGTGTVAIRASFNVSSITDNGTGDYTVNFTNAMSDVNYSATGNVGNNNIRCVLCFTSTATYLTSSVRIQAIDPQTSGGVDEAIVTLAVFR